MRGNFNKIEASTTDGHFPAASPSKTTRKNAQRHRRTEHIPLDWKKMKNAPDHGSRRRAVLLLEIVFTFCSLLRDDSMPVRAAALAITL
jgi:hypothetical protein